MTPNDDTGVIMAIDPGVTTGIAIIRDLKFCGIEVTSYAQVADLMQEYKPDVVIVEDFLVRRGRPGVYHPSIRMIGVVEYLCSLSGCNFVIQSPAVLQMRGKIIPDGIKSPHVRAATNHLMYYLAKTGESK